MLPTIARVAGTAVLLGATVLGIAWSIDFRGFTTRHVDRTFDMKVRYGEDPGPKWKGRRLLLQRVTGAYVALFGLTLLVIAASVALS